jgi:hypothetical protein
MLKFLFNGFTADVRRLDGIEGSEGLAESLKK